MKLSDGVDRDSGGESGHGAQAGRDTKTIQLYSPNLPHLMVKISRSVVFQKDLTVLLFMQKEN